jgi:hypothetical protein
MDSPFEEDAPLEKDSSLKEDAPQEVILLEVGVEIQHQDPIERDAAIQVLKKEISSLKVNSWSESNLLSCRI